MKVTVMDGQTVRVTFNRTSLELKRRYEREPNSAVITFNRTSLELKLALHGHATFHASPLLIEPVWN